MNKTLVAFTLILATAFAAFSDIQLTSTYTMASATGNIVNGAQASEGFGSKVSNAGKFTQTAYDDYAVGTAKGKVYIIRGQSSARSAAMDLLVASSSNFITFSPNVGLTTTVTIQVACAGKFTSTSRDSLIISIPSYDITGPGATKAGKAWIIYPRDSDLDWSATALAVGNGVEIIIGTPAQDDYLGRGISTAGQIIGDTFDDVVVSHQNDIYIIPGQGTTTPASITEASTGVIKIDGATADTDFGTYIAGDFDFNGDQKDDIVVGAPATAKAYVIYGQNAVADFTAFSLQTTPPAARFTSLVHPTAASLFGFNVANAGDIDNDGNDDLIIGAPALGTNAEGKAYVFFGYDTATNALKVDNIADVTTITPSSNTARGFIITGATANLQLGFESDGVGDLNYDGYDDIVVSAPGSVAGRGTVTGKVYVIFGRARANTYDIDLTAGTGNTAFTSTVGFTITGETGYGFGASVSAVGDVTGDGAPDFVVGSPASLSRSLATTATARATPGVVYQFNGQAKPSSGSGFRLEASLLVIVSFFAALMF